MNGFPFTDEEGNHKSKPKKNNGCRLTRCPNS